MRGEPLGTVSASGGSVTTTAITRLQGIYYLLTGLFPFVHFGAFEALTGRKRDRWLVRTVGLLAAVIGLTLVRRPSQSGELADVYVGIVEDVKSLYLNKKLPHLEKALSQGNAAELVRVFKGSTHD